MKRPLHHLIQSVTEHLISLDDALHEFLLAKKSENCSQRTLDYYEWNCQRFIAWCTETEQPLTVQEIQASHIRAYLQFRQDEGHVNDSSAQTYFRALRAWFNWSEADEMIPSSPFRSGKLKCPRAAQRIKPTYSDAEIRALLNTCDPSDGMGLRDRAIILVLLDTGMRAAELCGVLLADLERGRLRVLGKGKRERYLILSPVTEKALRDYMRRARPTDDAHLFVGTRGGMTPSGLYQMINRRAHEAAIDARGIHRFRHTFAYQWAKASGPLHALQATLGHESPIMSLRYGRMAGAQLEELHQQYSPVQNMDLGKKK